jgi:hypothetical protein
MRRFLIPLLIVGLLACRSSFNKKEPVFTGDNAAFFHLASATYPVEEIRKELPAQIAYPDLSEDVLSRILASLIFQRETVWGKTTRRVFYNEQLPGLALRMREVIAKLDEGKRLVVITRHDPDHSVLSHMERTTMLVWVDEAGLNLVLGEIRQELPHNDILERQDWLNILPVSLKRAYNDLSLAPGPYTLKTIRGFVHNTWAVFPLDQLSSLPAVPAHNRAGEEDKPAKKDEKKDDKKDKPVESTDKPAADMPVTEAPPAKTEPAPAAPEKKEPSAALKDRLTELKQALEQGLITQAEYDEKRKAILDKY